MNDLEEVIATGRVAPADDRPVEAIEKEVESDDQLPRQHRFGFLFVSPDVRIKSWKLE